MNWEIYTDALLIHMVGFVVMMAGAIVRRAIDRVS